jgi:hypothetical protein
VAAPSPRRVRTGAVVVATIALADTVLYVFVMRSQNDSPRAWFVGALGVAIALAVYAAVAAARVAPRALAAAGLLLIVLGVVGILSIGMPLVVAGGVAIVTAWNDDHSYRAP